jgi:hypothetical protein
VLLVVRWHVFRFNKIVETYISILKWNTIQHEISLSKVVMNLELRVVVGQPPSETNPSYETDDNDRRDHTACRSIQNVPQKHPQHPLPPWQYDGTSLLSYATLWKEQQQQQQQLEYCSDDKTGTTTTNNNKGTSSSGTGGTVFSLTFFSIPPSATHTNRPTCDCLIGCTSQGEILFWNLDQNDHHHTKNNNNWTIHETTMEPSAPGTNDTEPSRIQNQLEMSFPRRVPWNVAGNDTGAPTTTLIRSSQEHDRVASSNRPILRLRFHSNDRGADSNMVLYHCQMIERSMNGPYWLVVAGEHGTNEKQCVVSNANLL